LASADQRFETARTRHFRTGVLNEDGAWQFLGDSMTDTGGVLVCLHHPLDSDPSLTELADLPVGWCAERSKPGEPWTRYKHEPENNSTEE
jgi:hypothetical protein